MDFVTRLKQYIEYKQLQNSQVADMAGIPRPTLSQLLTGRNKKVSNELIEKLHSAFPALNVLWLLFGDGPMENDENIASSKPQIDAESDIFSPQLSENTGSYDDSSQVTDIGYEKDQKNEPRVWMAVAPSDVASSVPERRVKSIMVFYSDNSFEVFKPAPESGES